VCIAIPAQRRRRGSRRSARGYAAPAPPPYARAEPAGRPAARRPAAQRLPRMSKKDYYEVLGVARDVSEAELRKAYRKKAVQYHPGELPPRWRAR
jgi:hypothetical protein